MCQLGPFRYPPCQKAVSAALEEQRPRVQILDMFNAVWTLTQSLPAPFCAQVVYSVDTAE